MKLYIRPSLTNCLFAVTRRKNNNMGRSMVFLLLLLLLFFFWLKIEKIKLFDLTHISGNLINFNLLYFLTVNLIMMMTVNGYDN